MIDHSFSFILVFHRHQVSRHFPYRRLFSLTMPPSKTISQAIFNPSRWENSSVLVPSHCLQWHEWLERSDVAAQLSFLHLFLLSPCIWFHSGGRRSRQREKEREREKQHCFAFSLSYPCVFPTWFDFLRAKETERLSLISLPYFICKAKNITNKGKIYLERTSAFFLALHVSYADVLEFFTTTFAIFSSSLSRWSEEMLSRPTNWSLRIEK